jgi:hypothetical protein
MFCPQLERLPCSAQPRMQKLRLRPCPRRCPLSAPKTQSAALLRLPCPRATYARTFGFLATICCDSRQLQYAALRHREDGRGPEEFRRASLAGYRMHLRLVSGQSRSQKKFVARVFNRHPDPWICCMHLRHEVLSQLSIRIVSLFSAGPSGRIFGLLSARFDTA